MGIKKEFNTFIFEVELELIKKAIILNAKLNILKKELAAKIAVFAHQPHIDGDGFVEFSRNFKLEWNQIKQQMYQVNNRDIASTMRLNNDRKELNDLAEKAMEETDPLKSIMTEKLDQLMLKS
uniref:DUF1959 domain-containing protein n=1 Tax=Globodera pallida TaxID=36090 RepID=A0A183CGH8_GLOPA